MNITINNQPSPSFGVFKFKDNGGKRLFEYMRIKENPADATKNFIEQISKPIQKMKSTVTFDGHLVEVLAPSVSAKTDIIIDPHGKFAISQYNDNKVRIFTTYPNGGYSTNYKILSFKDSQEAMNFIDEVKKAPELEAEFLCARELARLYDEIDSAVQEQKVENVLKDLYV